jgi:nitrilase/aliphatic nitrilase
MIVSPSGKICSDVIRDNKEGIVYAKCDVSDCIVPKGIHDIAGSYQRSDVFRFEINRSVLKPVHITNEREQPLETGHAPTSTDVSNS